MATTQIDTSAPPHAPRTPALSVLAGPLLAATACWLLLLAASIAQDLHAYPTPRATPVDLIQLFDVDSERSLYTWLSAILLFGCAVLLSTVGLSERRAGQPHRAWFVLSAVFVALSADEHAGLHERLKPLMNMIVEPQGLFYFSWVIPMFPICILGAVASIGFLRQLPARVRYLTMLSAVTFVGGAVGVEMLGGAVTQEIGQGNMTYRSLASLEEAMEGAGVLLFLYAIDLFRRGRERAAAAGQ